MVPDIMVSQFSQQALLCCSEVVQELQQQLAALQAEKQRVEADRQEMAVKQGNYKGIIAQVSRVVLVVHYQQQVLATGSMVCASLVCTHSKLT